MTAAAGLKRLGIMVAAAISAGILALAAISALIPADTVRDAVKAEIKAATGLDPLIRGDVAISLFPSGTVSFGDVALEDAGRTAFTAERLTARLSLLPLLIGRIEPADIALVRPHVAVTIDADGRSNWSGLLATLTRALKPDVAGRALSFSEIRVTGGTVTVRDDAHAINETLADVEISLAWPSIGKSLGAIGRFVWRGQAVDASVNVADLLAALTGDRSGFKVRLGGASFKLAFEGNVSHRPTLKVEGTLAADGTSLRETLRWTGLAPLPGGGFGPYALKAQTSIVGGMVALTGVNVELDGNTAEGVLTLSTDARTVVKGTLAAEALDLTPYVSTVQLIRTSEREWSRIPIALDGLESFDLDLRLSAARVTIANARLGRTGVAANLRDGRMTVTIGESQAYGGLLKGSFAFAKAPAGAEIKSQLQFTDVELENCLNALFGIRRLEGKGTFTFAIEGAGESVFALTQTLNGTASLTARQGALAGFDVEQLLRRLERRPLSGGGNFRTGRTPFETLAVTVKIARGKVALDEVRLDGTAVKLALAGSASIAERDLDLKGTASLVQAATDGTRAFELPFVVQGPWDDPIMLPDARSLIERAPAAAPIRDAVRELRDHRNRERVIQQLKTGVVPQLPAAATPEPAVSPQQR